MLERVGFVPKGYGKAVADLLPQHVNLPKGAVVVAQANDALDPHRLEVFVGWPAPSARRMNSRPYQKARLWLAGFKAGLHARIDYSERGGKL